MAFLDDLKETITNKPTHLREPQLYKTNTDSQTQLEQLQAFAKSAPKAIRDQIDHDIRALQYGLAGEAQILFELMNSHLPIIILQDLRLEADGLSTQIDFLVIATKMNFVIECKNLYGDIEVTNQGDFIRTVSYNGHQSKEGFYSPITQNTRHLKMIKKLRLDQRNTPLTKSIFEKGFDLNYQSLIVLANPKTILDVKYAPKEIKSQIIRADQLVRIIKQRISESKEPTSFERSMYELADFFGGIHKPNPNDYLGKYQQNAPIDVVSENPLPVNPLPTEETIRVDSQHIEETPVYQALKKYRYETSQEEGVKAYFIFNNADLEELIKVNPKTLDELKTVRNFGDVKCQKYGAAILEILKKNWG